MNLLLVAVSMDEAMGEDAASSHRESCRWSPDYYGHFDETGCVLGSARHHTDSAVQLLGGIAAKLSSQATSQLLQMALHHRWGCTAGTAVSVMQQD